MEQLLKSLEPQFVPLLLVVYLLIERFVPKRSRGASAGCEELVTRLRRMDHDIAALRRGQNRVLRANNLEEEH